MIELYSWVTPNGYKVSILLEELGLDYSAHAVDIQAGEQFEPAFLRISPNNRIPAIVDTDGPGNKPISVFESGAILLYLAEKTGRYWPSDPRQRTAMLEWLMFQMGNVGPMFGQVGHFTQYAREASEYATNRYIHEMQRLMGVMDRRLGEVAYLAGEYGLADMATFPWLRSARRFGADFSEYPQLGRWYDAIRARPAVDRGLRALSEYKNPAPLSDAAREQLFGDAQYRRR
ncbi:MAG: glutathione S-transferase N-terminal domain-containing protein [Salinisphaera sp.]|nr:glutathione S-transferase N-terminal domain-containing protein [Salinisphaera sp.]